MPPKPRQEDLTATSLTFTTTGGKSFTTAEVRKEVVLSSGSFQDPQLLELSGFGDPKILNPLGIKPLLKNAGVGANLQDHLLVPLSFEVKDGEPALDPLARDPQAFAEALQLATVNHTGLLVSGTLKAYLSLEQITKILGPNDTPKELQNVLSL